MGYVNDNLMPGESVVYAAKLHWFGLVVPIAVCISGFVIMLLSYAPLGGFGAYFGVIGSLALFAGAIGSMESFVSIRSSELAVTSQRVIIKVGFVRRRTREVLLDKVETIGVDQGAIGRMFGFGDVTVVGTGGSKEPVANVANPLEFRRRVLLEIAR